MAPPKRVRWECPAGEHPGVLGSTRPAKKSIVRFCLPCSEREGVLVERTAPALERQRAVRRDASASKRAKAAEREAARQAAAFIVQVPDYEDGLTAKLDVRDLLRRAWRSEVLVDLRSQWSTTPAREPVPELTLRRGKNTRTDQYSPARIRDGAAGHASPYGGDIVLTIAPHCGREWVEAIVIHEATHAAAKGRVHHGDVWRSAYLRTVKALYGIEGVALGPQANWRLDEEIAAAIRAKGMR